MRTTSRDFGPVAFSRLIDQYLNDSTARAGGSTFRPSVDVAETNKGYEIHISVPGMNKEDFHLGVEENRLIVSGERKWTQENVEKTFHKVETSYGDFARTFLIPENARANGIEASYHNGILKVFIPKDEQKAARTTIKVN